MGERRLFYGGVDETSVTAGAAGRRLKLLARGPGAVLLDNEALPWIYTNVDLQRIFDEHIKPYGFETLVYDNNAIFNHYQVQKGMSEWEVLYNFARNASSLPAYIDSEVRANGRRRAALLFQTASRTRCVFQASRLRTTVTHRSRVL